MRIFVVLSLVLAATALPDPSDAGSTEFSDAKAEVTSLLAMGKDDKACRDLANSNVKAVESTVKTQQKMLDALPDGKDCDKAGQSLVKSADAELEKANKKLKKANSAVKEAEKTSLTYKTTYGDSKGGKCVVDKSGSAYNDAKKKYDAAKSAVENASGAVTEAKKALKRAKKAAAKKKLECLCHAKKAHAKGWALATKDNARNQKSYTKAKHMLCVLEGKSYDKCKQVSAPKVKKPEMSKAVKNAQCAASPCPGGKLGRSPGTSKFQEINRWGTWEQCLKKCRNRKGCKAVLYGFDWEKKDCTMFKDHYNARFEDSSHSCVANIDDINS